MNTLRIDLCAAIRIAGITLLLLFWASAGSTLSAQQKGSPLVKHFTPDEYGGHTQVFDITQAPDNTLLFSTGQGIIQYDGARFRAIDASSRMITAVFAASNDSIFFGGNGFFGTLVATPTASFQYVNHSARWESRNIGGPFNFIEFKGDVYFPLRETFLRFREGVFDTIPSPVNRFFRSYTIHDELYVIDQVYGLFRMNSNDSLVAAAGGETFIGDLNPYFFLPYDEERVVFGTVRNGLYWYYPNETGQHAAGTILPFPNEVNEILSNAITFQGIALKSGNYAIGTGNAGVFIINRQGELIHRIDQSTGISPDFVNALFEDRQGNLWIGQNNGLILAEIASPLSRYGESSGLTGLSIDMVDIGGDFFVSTSTGLFKLEDGMFVANEGVNAVTWELAPHLNPDGTKSGKVFAANHFALYLADGQQAQLIHQGATSSVLHSALNPEILYIGTQLGMLRYEYDGGSFQRREILPMEDPVRYLLESPSGGIWTALQAAGVRYIPASFDTTAIRVYRQDEEGVPFSNAFIRYIHDELYLTNNEWLYKYDQESGSFLRFSPPGLSHEDLKGAFHFDYDGGTMWLGSSAQRERITEIRDFFGESPEIITHPFASVSSGTITLRTERGLGDIWFGTTTGLYRYKPDFIELTTEFNGLIIRQVEVITDTTASFFPVSSQNPRLSFSNARFRFNVAAPWFNAQEFMQYRYRLSGVDDQWSNWTSQSFVEYTSLREGVYTFEVQARNREGVQTDTVKWSFVITPPWFRTIWAYGLYLIGLLMLIYAASRQLTKMKVKKLEEFNRELERQVAERSEEIRKQNERLRQMNEEKADFMNIAAHDLRNPLSAIMSIGSIMADKSDIMTDEDRLQFADIISKSSDRMLELIDNYLNVHKLEQGDVRAETVPIVLEEEVNSAIERFETQAKKKNMTVTFNIKSPKTVVVADPALTAQVLDNVISNAVKYAPIGSEIVVNLQKDGNVGCVTVTDAGPGIPVEKQSELYKKFSKIGSIPTGGEVSTGLGLSIVKQLLSMMHGDIYCDSSPGKGTSFTISLPAE